MNEFLMHKEIVCKGIGICLILIAAIGCGNCYNNRLKLRLEQLRQLQQFMLLLEGEIQYQCSMLPEAFITCGKQVNGVCGQWWIEMGERLNAMEGEDFQTIWVQQLKCLYGKTQLSEASMNDLKRLGNQLSFPDRDTQLGAMRLYAQKLQKQEEQLTGELPVKTKMGVTFGVLSGLFLIILLI